MAITEPTRHGRLGDVGWSAAIAMGIQVLPSEHGGLVGGSLLYGKEREGLVA
jgi:hypothetical protein